MDLSIFSKAYYNGKPIISDDHYDALASIYGEEDNIGTTDNMGIKHAYRMFSLQKVFDDDPMPSACVGQDLVETPKLDGSAISLLYIDGNLVRGLMRGDGVHAQRDITNKVLIMDTIPNHISELGQKQITGEVIFLGEAENIRNQAAGSLGLKDLVEFKGREKDLYFVSYSFYPGTVSYLQDMQYLEAQGFRTVVNTDKDEFLTDGTVFRINDNDIFYRLGNTAKHPKGSFARKMKSDVAIEESTVLDVIWNTGATGKVTPVCLIEEVIIDDAKINRLTLHNVGYVEDLKLDIGDKILVTRAGSVIPKILGNVTKDVYLYD